MLGGNVMNFRYMLIKLIAGFIMLIVYLKVSGRSQLAPLTASDQVGNMVIGALVSTAIISPDVSILEAIILVFMWAGLQILVRFIKFRSSNAAEFFDGSPDRKSTRLNSSHVSISYAVFCLKKKRERTHELTRS